MKTFPLLVAICLISVGCSGFYHRGDLYFGSSSYGLPASQVQPEVHNTGGVEITRSSGHYHFKKGREDLTYIGGVDLPPPVAGVRMVVVETITTPAIDVTIDYPWWLDTPWQSYYPVPGGPVHEHIEGPPPPRRR